MAQKSGVLAILRAAFARDVAEDSPSEAEEVPRIIGEIKGGFDPDNPKVYRGEFVLSRKLGPGEHVYASWTNGHEFAEISSLPVHTFARKKGGRCSFSFDLRQANHGPITIHIHYRFSSRVKATIGKIRIRK